MQSHQNIRDIKFVLDFALVPDPKAKLIPKQS